MTTFTPTCGDHITWTTWCGPTTAKVLDYTNRVEKHLIVRASDGHDESYIGHLPNCRLATDDEIAEFEAALARVTR